MKFLKIKKLDPTLCRINMTMWIKRKSHPNHFQWFNKAESKTAPSRWLYLLKSEYSARETTKEKLLLKWTTAVFGLVNESLFFDNYAKFYWTVILGTTHLRCPHGRRWEEALKFVMCLRILSFLNNRSIAHFCGWGVTKLVIFCGLHKYMTL